nr:hypothetical protein [Tanacetum cinerariifolium]GEW56578.1 hypothetical protein [Tanacetum cinerariifolium]
MGFRFSTITVYRRKEATIQLIANGKIGFVLRLVNVVRFTIVSKIGTKDTETTSQGNSDSAHIGLNLNDEAADSKDVDVQEVAPMGRDRAKKKASSSGARSKTSIAGDHSLVDALLSKFTMAATSFFAEE